MTKAAAGSVKDTLARLERLIDKRGLVLFAVVDHSGAATTVGQRMPDTKLVIFGSPAAGTPVMLAAPLAALDLPLKLLIWEDRAGNVWVSYASPAFLAERHHLSAELRAHLEPIEAISDAVIASS